MSIDHSFQCGLPCCQYSGASLSSSFFPDDEIQSVKDVDSHHVLTPHSHPSSSGVTAPSLPSAAQPKPSTLEDPGDPAYAQLPPDDVLDYWIRHFELTLPSTSAKDSTFPPSVLVINDIGPIVSSILFILYTGCILFVRCVHICGHSDWFPSRPTLEA
jgi:hypothetical protein